MKIQIPLALICCLFLGCSKTIRSISQSGYHDSYSYTGPGSRELDELDVLGIEREKAVSEEDIQRATNQIKPVKLAPGTTILLVQSGAVYPDGPMVTELGKHLNIVPFTGVASEKSSPQKIQAVNQAVRNAIIITDPDKPATIVPFSTTTYPTYRTDAPKPDSGAYSRQLRLAAAQAGATAIVCYWGILESGSEHIATKTISWFPVAGWILPEEKQLMRIKLKMAVIDVGNGNWSVCSVTPSESTRWSSRRRREVNDQRLVESLKKKAYEVGAKELLARYSTIAAR